MKLKTKLPAALLLLGAIPTGAGLLRLLELAQRPEVTSTTPGS